MWQDLGTQVKTRAGCELDTGEQDSYRGARPADQRPNGVGTGGFVLGRNPETKRRWDRWVHVRKEPRLYLRYYEIL